MTPRLAITLAGARHFAFSDLLFLLPVLTKGDPRLERVAAQLTGTVSPSATLATERLYLTTFFDRYLKR